MRTDHLSLLFICLFALISCNQKPKESDKADPNDPQSILSDWIIENEAEHMLVEKADNIIEIIAPQGLTLWYNQKLTGEYEISYRIAMVVEGNLYDRLSDMNCFWAASDPEHPEDLFARTQWRKGAFKKYNTLNLFYVGHGGNENTTTRFRQYHGEYYGKDDDKIKPLLQEYTDENHLLKPDRWYQITIKVTKNETTYTVDGETLFRLPIKEGEGDGYFAIRLLTNHIQLMDFNVTEK